jgi:hypothetical protein
MKLLSDASDDLLFDSNAHSLVMIFESWRGWAIIWSNVEIRSFGGFRCVEYRTQTVHTAYSGAEIDWRW